MHAGILWRKINVQNTFEDWVFITVYGSRNMLENISVLLQFVLGFKNFLYKTKVKTIFEDITAFSNDL